MQAGQDVSPAHRLTGIHSNFRHDATRLKIEIDFFRHFNASGDIDRGQNRVSLNLDHLNFGIFGYIVGLGIQELVPSYTRTQHDYQHQ